MSHVKRVTLSIVPGESCGLQTPVILMARLLFHGCGDKSRRVPPPHRAGLDQGGRSGEAGRSITFYIVLIMSDVCGGGGERGPACIHHSLGGIRGEDRTGCRAGRQTPPLSSLSFLHRLRQRARRIYIISVRHGIQSVCSAALSGTKFEAGAHSSRHMLLFSPSERLMGLIHNFNRSEMLL